MRHTEDGFELWPIPRGKNDPNFKSFTHGCLTKRAYDNAEAAAKDAACLGKNEKCQTQIYRCKFCGKWHVTHKAHKVTKKNRNIIVTNEKGNPYRNHFHSIWSKTEIFKKKTSKMHRKMEAGKKKSTSKKRRSRIKPYSRKKDYDNFD